MYKTGMRKPVWFGLSLTMVALSSLAIVPSAEAQVTAGVTSDKPVTEFTITEGTPEFNTTVVYAFDKPLSKQEANAAKGLITKNMKINPERIATKTVNPASSAASLASTPGWISCAEKNHKWSDGNGTFAAGIYCGRTDPRIFWTFQLSPAHWSASANGLCSEDGMRWTYNGKQMPKQAPHPNVSIGYNFHGTFRPIAVNSEVTYGDKITYRHNINGGGTVTVNMSGVLYPVK